MTFLLCAFAPLRDKNFNFRKDAKTQREQKRPMKFATRTTKSDGGDYGSFAAPVRGGCTLG
jgi:hypothetical protein